MRLLSRLWLLLLVALLSGVLPLAQAAPPTQETDPREIAEALLANLLAGDYAAASADFDETMLGALPVEALQQSWESVLNDVGPFQTRLGRVQTPLSGYTVVIFTLQHERGVIDVMVGIDQAGKVAGLHTNAGPGALVIGLSLVDRLVAGDYAGATADFDAEMLAALPAAALQQTWEDLLAQLGAFQAVVGSQFDSNGTYSTVVVTLQFEQAALDAQIAVNAEGRVSGLYFRPSTPPASDTLPSYANSDTFTEQDITLNEGTDWTLPGTLTLPVGDGPFPAVVLVHGSGPNDRDETIGPNKPFRDLAAGLASNGIAVLRYDKRTLVHGQAMVTQGDFTIAEETVNDALAAVALLQTMEQIDPARIFVLGHSLGGYMAPRIGAQNPNIAGLIVLAGNARPLTELVLEQVNYLAGLDGTVSDEEQAEIDSFEEAVTNTQKVQPGDDPAALLFGAPAAYWVDLKTYDPVAVALTLDIPMLFLQGERDYQVTMTDSERWRAGLAARNDVTFIAYPDLNHLFMSGSGPSQPSEYEQPGYVDEVIINDIVNWIQVH